MIYPQYFQYEYTKIHYWYLLINVVKYEIDMKKIMSPGGTTVGLANGVVLADGKKIYSADNLKVGLFK